MGSSADRSEVNPVCRRMFVVILIFNEDLPRATLLHLSRSSLSTTRPLPLARSQPIVSHHHWPPRHSTPIKPRTFCRSAYSSLTMEAARTSETSVDNHFTRQYNPEDSSEHHTRRRENLKSHMVFLSFWPSNQNPVHFPLLSHACPMYLLDLICLIIFGDECKMWSSSLVSLCSHVQIY
jgi:hypothetical protein